MITLATQFIEFVLAQDILQFGDFTLKSGRKSPYFFNAGKFNTGQSIATLGEFYAERLHTLDIDFDLIFGPAYKGIPLAIATAIAFAKKYQRDVPYAFNRKEAKEHGEGGSIVGADILGNIVLIDDVITAGTAIRQSIEIIKSKGANIRAILIALDRQEKGVTQSYALDEIQQEFSIPVYSLVQLSDIVEFTANKKEFNQIHQKLAALL